MAASEVGQMSRNLLDVLEVSDYPPTFHSKDKLTSDKLEWLFEYDGFADFFTVIAEVVSEENVISADLLSRYDDVCQISEDDVLPSDDVMEVLGSLAKLSLQNDGCNGEDGGGFYPERIMTSTNSGDLVKKECSLLHKQAESLQSQARFIQSQVHVQRLSVAQKEDLLKWEQKESAHLDEQIADAAGELGDVVDKLRNEISQLGAFYSSETINTGGNGCCGVMSSLPFSDIYKMEEYYASKFTAYTRKQLGHKGVIHLTTHGAPVEKSSRMSNTVLSSTNGVEHIRNAELAACFRALTPARTMTKQSASGGHGNKRLSFMRPSRSMSFSGGASRLSNTSSAENRPPDGRLTVEEMTVILQEIYANYGLALMERTQAIVERDRLVGSVSFLDQFLAKIEKGELSTIVPSIDLSMTRADRKYVDLKLKVDNVFRTGPNTVASSIDRLISLSVESILDCGLDLELKRKEYVLDKRNEVIGYLKAICSRGLLIRLLLEHELNCVKETVSMGDKVVDDVNSYQVDRLARKAFFGRSHFNLKQLPKYAVDSANVFLTTLHGLLLNAPFPKDDQLDCCKKDNNASSVLTFAHLAEHIDNFVDNFAGIGKTIKKSENEIFKQTAVLTSLINKMRSVLSNDSLPTSPSTMLSNLADRLMKETDVLEVQLTKEMHSVEEMKQVMADPLIFEERLFFTKFFGVPGTENDAVNAVISDLQTKLAF